MPKIAYVEKNLSSDRLAVINQANVILTELRAQGFSITLRQLYYQFVSRGYIANKDTEYKRLGDIVADGRMCGLIDWNHLEDRTRNPSLTWGYESPEEPLQTVGSSYKRDRWEGQDYRVEVWIEKDALVGVIQGACRQMDVASFSCRGYTSLSEMWVAAQRLIEYSEAGWRPVILHLGDHDPSGIDMSRDILDRLTTFMEGGGCDGPEFKRIALNMDQVLALNPPPNPAKLTDARATRYIATYGTESWELDAVPPQQLAQLVRDEVEKYRDPDIYRRCITRENEERAMLKKIETNWETVRDMVAAL